MGQASVSWSAFFIFMKPKAWQRVDKNYSHCAECMKVFRNIMLTDGVCDNCFGIVEERSIRAIRRMESKVVSKATKASAEFLASMKEQGKDGKSMPRILDSLWKVLQEPGLSGEEAFGRQLGEEYNKSRGIGLSPDEAANYEPSQKLRQGWFELILRYSQKVDEGKSLDIGSLDESELEAILTDVAIKAATTDNNIAEKVVSAYIEKDRKRRESFFMDMCEAYPELENKVLEKHGIVTIEAQEETQAIPHQEDEEDYDPEAEAYDPDNDN